VQKGDSRKPQDTPGYAHRVFRLKQSKHGFNVFRKTVIAQASVDSN